LTPNEQQVDQHIAANVANCGLIWNDLSNQLVSPTKVARSSGGGRGGYRDG
jgi:hypothetical protein